MPLLIILVAVLVISFLIAELQRRYLLAWVIKAFASFTFIVLFASSALFEWSMLTVGHLTFVLLGLIAGMMGDVVLALRPLRPQNDNHFIILVGIMSFLMGHLFYGMALLELSTWSWWVLPVSLVATGGVIALSYWQHYQMGITRLPTYLYSLVIFTVVSQAVVYGIATGFALHSVLWIMATIVFMLSDLLLSAIYFMDKKSPRWVIANILLYYAAQVLIASSVAWIS